MEHDEFWKACEPGELRRLSVVTQGGKRMKLDPHAPNVVHTTFNVAQEGLREPEWTADFLARLTGVELAPERRDALVTVLRSLPPDTTMLGLIHHIKEHEAEQLGISPENYDALGPLFEALGTVQRNNRWFEPEANGKPQD